MFVGREEELNKLRVCTPNRVANGAAYSRRESTSLGCSSAVAAAKLNLSE